MWLPRPKATFKINYYDKRTNRKISMSSSME